jgi:hypothetical protein
MLFARDGEHARVEHAVVPKQLWADGLRVPASSAELASKAAPAVLHAESDSTDSVSDTEHSSIDDELLFAPPPDYDDVYDDDTAIPWFENDGEAAQKRTGARTRPKRIVALPVVSPDLGATASSSVSPAGRPKLKVYNWPPSPQK